MPGVVLVGAGPRIGLPVARRFAREGLPVALIARSQATLDATAAALAADGAETVSLIADSADEAGLKAALDEATAAFGTPDALIYNAGVLQRDAPGELSARQQLDAWAVNVVGALTAATHLAPAMVARGSGTIILTGGRPLPASMVSMTLGKAGVRALATVLHEAYGEAGVHAATVTICGAVAPGTAFDPDDIAEDYWRLHTQAPADWQQEIVRDG